MHRLLIVWAVLHLVVMALGAGYVKLEKLGFLGEAITLYGSATGAGSTYGFFAPGVGGDLQALFDVVDDKGTRTTTTLLSGFSHEADLRLHGIAREFITDDPEAKTLQRSLAASLAGTMFGRFPNAREVSVRLEEFWPVSMAEYRKGMRPAWTPLYEAKFVPAVNQVVGQNR